MKKTIPKKFKLLGHNIKVRYDNNRMDDMNALGLCEPTFNVLSLAKKTGGKKMPKSTIEHTYWHEVTHRILRAMGENDLYKNEAFVDNFAGCLHQVIKSSKY